MHLAAEAATKVSALYSPRRRGERGDNAEKTKEIAQRRHLLIGNQARRPAEEAEDAERSGPAKFVAGRDDSAH
jgi:hypothetical protein